MFLDASKSKWVIYIKQTERCLCYIKNEPNLSVLLFKISQIQSTNWLVHRRSRDQNNMVDSRRFCDWATWHIFRLFELSDDIFIMEKDGHKETGERSVPRRRINPKLRHATTMKIVPLPRSQHKKTLNCRLASETSVKSFVENVYGIPKSQRMTAYFDVTPSAAKRQTTRAPVRV